MHKTASNLFIALFLGAIFTVFITDSYFWPFMAYDMYTFQDYGQLRFTGSTSIGSDIPINAAKYFRHSSVDYYFNRSILNIYRDEPNHFSLLMHTLKERYNAKAAQKILKISVVWNISDTESVLGTFQ